MAAKIMAGTSPAINASRFAGNNYFFAAVSVPRSIAAVATAE
jgi:hypothetical protein